MIQALCQNIGRFFLWLSGQRGRLESGSSEMVENPVSTQPTQRSSYWQTMIRARNIVSGKVLTEIRDALNHRQPTGREHTSDDALFGPLASATAVSIAQGEYQLAISLFYDCYQLARDYENQHGTEIHKGAMTFNVAVAFLRSHDFPAAMHFFELSRYETEQSYGHANWNIFNFDLFDNHYWNLIDLFEQDHPLEFYQAFWNTDYGTPSAKLDWNALSDHSKLLYIMIGAERIRFARLKSQPNWNGADSIGLSYWNLVADLVRLLETEIRQMGIIGQGLNDMILNQINHSPVPNFKANVTAFRAAHPIHSPADFNTHFPTLRTVIENPAESTERRIACAAYLAGSTRNQVQHQVDSGMVIYTDRSAGVFTVNALICLCRLSDWVA